MKITPLWIKIAIFLQNLNSLFLDTIFPINCIVCGVENYWLCEVCSKKIKLRDQQFCPLCEKIITPDGQACFACKKKSALSGILVAASYQDPIISKAVHLFKYRFIKELSKPLATLIVRAIQSYELPLPELIIPIPLHPRRLRWRGFNQSTLLAKDVAENLLPDSPLTICTTALVRNRYTLPQMSLRSLHDRNLNISNAFTVSDVSAIENKRILLVDDIATTGSTIFECARILKAAGAKEIYATVIARQEYKQKS